MDPLALPTKPERSELVTCNADIDHAVVLELLSLRLPYLMVYAHGDTSFRSSHNVCGSEICGACSFVLVQSGFEPNSDKRIYPMHETEKKLPDVIYPLLKAEVDLRSAIDIDSKIHFTGEHRVEKYIGELKARASVAVTSILGDTLIIRSTHGVELLRYLVDERRSMVEVIAEEDSCDRMNAEGGSMTCFQEEESPKAPEADWELPPRSELTPWDTIDVPEYIFLARDAQLRNLRLKDWEERQQVKVAQLKDGPRFSELGFKKVRLNAEVWSVVRAAYEVMLPEQVVERWPPQSVLLNHWDAWTYKVFTGDTLTSVLEQALLPHMEMWTKQEVHSLGVADTRRYSNGTLIGYHVDQPSKHMFTIIINVDQDLDEPWPLEIFDHHGKLHEIHLAPRTVVFLESSVCVHGRMKPLRGRFVSNMFMHFTIEDMAIRRGFI